MRSHSMFALLMTLLLGPSSAEIITNNLTISDANKAMVAAGYKQTEMAMIARNFPKEDLQLWDVDQGVLIAAFSNDTKRIVGLTFYLCDERPKALRQTFRFMVDSFDTKTGVLTIKTKKPDEDSADQPATTPELKPEIKDNPNPTSNARPRKNEPAPGQRTPNR